MKQLIPKESSMTHDLMRLIAGAVTMSTILAMTVFPLEATAAERAAAASQAASDVRARPAFGPLSAGQIMQIQGLGRSVLTAKHNQLPTEEEQTLVVELRALSQEIEQATQPQAGKIEAGSVVAERPMATRSQVVRSALLPRLTKLQQRRVTLESASSRPSAATANAEGADGRQSRLHRLSQQAQDIERSVQAALELPEGQRHAKLVELSHRLKPRTHDEWIGEQRRAGATGDPKGLVAAADQGSPTPTLTTLTQHRPGPKSQAPSEQGRGAGRVPGAERQ